MPENEMQYSDVMKSTPPGISWTAPEKSRPWQNPPQVTDINDLATNYMSRLSSPDMIDSVMDALETRAPIASIAETFMMNGVSQGIHTLDAGILVMPVIIEVLATVAIMNNIRTVMYPEDLEQMSTLPQRAVKMAVKEALNPTIAKVKDQVPEDTKRGLMARKQKETV